MEISVVSEIEKLYHIIKKFLENRKQKNIDIKINKAIQILNNYSDKPKPQYAKSYIPVTYMYLSKKRKNVILIREYTDNPFHPLDVIYEVNLKSKTAKIIK